MTGATGPARTVDALQALLAGEHAAVYGYGALGARLPEPDRTTARRTDDVHRARRDTCVALLRGLGAEPVPAEPAYAVPVLATPAAALDLAVRLEEGLTGLARDLVGATDDQSLRSFGAGALADAAVRAAGWRQRAGRSPVTVPLPGDPVAPTG